MIRVRFAPSPTGPLHIGGVRTALYNYLFAKKMGGSMILRIEDTDQTRFVEGAEQYIIDSLTWCGIMFDEGVHIGGNYGPYKQSERKHLYKQYAEQLIYQGYAYYAFDTSNELEKKRLELEQQKSSALLYDVNTRMLMKNSLTLPEKEVKQLLENNTPYVIRIKIPKDEIIVVNDLIRGRVEVHSNNLDDKVLFKSDGMPTYHLANVVDDYLMQITHVIRGEEWLPSAPLHVLLYKFLGWESKMPQFAHLPLLLKPDGNGKLSKRDGDRLGFPVFPMNWKDSKTGEPYLGYKENGYLPEAVINFLALLGWNPGTEQEIFSLEELISLFSIERVSKSGAKFDYEKAKWFNQQYLRQKETKELAQLLSNELPAKYKNYSLEYLEKVSKLMLERITFLKDIIIQAPYFFEAPQYYDEKFIKKAWKQDSLQHIQQLIPLFNAIQNFTAAAIEEKFKNYLSTHQLNIGQVMAPLRLILTGMGNGPAVFDICETIGKKEVISRMQNIKL